MQTLQDIRKSYSLPMQILVGFILLIQIFILGILLYLKTNFENSIPNTTILGWIMFIVFIVFLLWNIASLIHRKSLLSKATEYNQKLQIYKSSVYSRYLTMLVIAVIALIFTLITSNMFYLLFFAFSFIWQVCMFPSRTKIALTIGDEAKETPQQVETAEPEQTNN